MSQTDVRGRDEEWQGRWAGGCDGCVFCGSLAGDLSEERIQKWLLFVEAQFRDILRLKCQAPRCHWEAQGAPTRTRAV